ncbi:MAG: hypothetical protein ACTH7W_06005 [Psychrobacter sp.]|uniref:hypothetical protein n=1 Tax=unclassified Psychrobacter TaxID=196806 RepID=UPI0017881ACD|nr:MULTISPECIES: hypothetical protein [unclassified Psychrobacter]MBE0441676.1 hypothetical protein [Psychrobacter sp. FME13]
MKTVHQAIVGRLPSTIKNHTLLTSVFITGALLLTGCQSTSLGQSSSVTAQQTPTAAKTALATALKKQRRQSFSYHGNLEINNDQYVTNVDQAELVTADYVDTYCEETHDQAYADLVAQAQTQNNDVMDAEYDAQRAALKDTYLECSDAYEAWIESDYDSDITVPPSYQQLFDNYYDKTTPSDIKKAKLLDAYLLKPLSINAQGIYQPMVGKATMLASVQYKARNHQSSINQPIYIDFKNGNIYLWADNFAMLNSELLDDKLGTTWQNKWLKVALDDGTLPKGFGSEVIKAHFEALDRTFEAAPVSQFDYVAPNTLVSLSPKLPEHQLPAMLASDQVIRRLQSAESYEQFYQDYMRIFYNHITEQYPELVKSNEAYSENDTNMDVSTDTFTSKALVQQALAAMKNSMNNDGNVETVEDEMGADTAVQELYGFDKRGKLAWQHTRNTLHTASNTSDKGLVIDALQQYSAINKDIAFPNLPNDAQVPNDSNSVDARQYSKELLQYYRDGNGTALGKMMFNLLPMAQDEFAAID